MLGNLRDEKYGCLPGQGDKGQKAAYGEHGPAQAASIILQQQRWGVGVGGDTIMFSLPHQDPCSCIMDCLQPLDLHCGSPARRLWH